MDMGSDYLLLNVIVCGINGINNQITERLFPERRGRNKRQIKRDEIFYTARIYEGRVGNPNNLNMIKEYLVQILKRKEGEVKLRKMLYFVFQMKT